MKKVSRILEKDEYICPNNKRLRYQYTETNYSKLGYKKIVRRYTCEDCSNCPNKKECTKSQTNRSIQINLRQNELRAEAREMLLSEESVKLRKKRFTESESVFGQIKWNSGFKRFLMGGLDKVNFEFGLISIAHNFKNGLWRNVPVLIYFKSKKGMTFWSSSFSFFTMIKNLYNLLNLP